MLVTPDQQIPIINRRCVELLDLPPQMIESPPRFDELTRYQAEASGVAEGGLPSSQSVLDIAGPGQVLVSEYRPSNGKVIEVCSDCLPDGGILHTFADITKRREAEAHIARLAAEDPLTGLPNRRVFSAALDQISGQRSDSRQTDEFAVLFLDLDRFKAVNDTLGHRIGDRLLQEVAKRLEWSLGSNSVLARLGGDEFAVIVPTFVSRAALEASALRLAKAISEPYELDGHRVCTNVSIGIAVGPGDGESVDDLLMAADLALYAVKATGRGTYRFYDKSMNEELSDRRHIEMDLREAVARDELSLHYQPIIDLQRNVITGFEALARWKHPVRGMIPPAGLHLGGGRHGPDPAAW